MPYPHADAVIEQLWRQQPGEEPPQVFAILDGARDERIYPAVLQCDEEYACLYRGEIEPDVAEAAPYLVRLRRESPFPTWLIETGWGESWGILLQSAASLAELRRHFRRFLMVYDPNGKPLYFRYYDPRVLRVYLPTCTAGELRVVFGPVRRFCLEAESRNTLLEFGLRGGTLSARTVALAPPGSAST